MSLRNTGMRATGKLFITLMFVATVGAYGESLSPSSKQGDTPFADKNWRQVQEKADSGSANAQAVLGWMYFAGIDGLPEDAAKAAEWFQKAAAQGNAFAQNMLGRMYYRGEGVSKNIAKAVDWYQKAAAQGYASAQLILGVMY